MITNLLLATILSTSFSVRTPNDVTKPLDYELSIKAENDDSDFTYFLKRDWERELGEKYIDDVFRFNHNRDIFYAGVDYVHKSSKDIYYTTYNIGLNHKSGFKIGASLKDELTLLSTSFDKQFKRDDLEYNIGISIKTNFDKSDIYNIKSEIKKWFGKFNIFGLYKHEYYNKKEDVQFKIGFGVKL